MLKYCINFAEITNKFTVMHTANETIINVPELHPSVKHETIFQGFDNLEEGSSLIIHNDHDPKPLYFHLQSMHGDTFTWEYLQQGPQWWDVRITKRGKASNVLPEGAITRSSHNEIIITVPLIEPRLKHQTIFGTFDELENGRSMIIHNDHDPRPVYFQLQSMHGDIFSWEYLQQGPQWWDIRVTKRVPGTKEGELPEGALTKNENNDIVITIPIIEPKLKHPTIFKVFDSLKPGESLVIHNDHDPKPVYYQLLGERGDVFTWTYLLQGPEWWDIKVTRRTEEDNETVGQIAAKDLRKAEIFKKYGIDFCCGGKKTVREVCAEKGIDATKVEQELQQSSQSITGGNLNFNEWNIDFLADYIVNTHHAYVRKYIPELQMYASKVAKVHGASHPELAPIDELVSMVCAELSEHMVEEENAVFPQVKQIAQAKNNNAKIEVTSPTFEELVDKMEAEHDTVGRAMEKIRELSNDYAIPADACASYTLLYKMLVEFESDLFTHIHLENNILFPKTIEIEKTLR